MTTREEAVAMVREVREIVSLIPNLSEKEKADAKKRLEEIRHLLIVYRRSNPNA